MSYDTALASLSKFLTSNHKKQGHFGFNLCRDSMAPELLSYEILSQNFLSKVCLPTGAWWILLSRGHWAYLAPCERDTLISQKNSWENIIWVHWKNSANEESWVVGPSSLEATFQFLEIIPRKWFRGCHVINRVEPIDMINASMHS